MRYLLSFVMLLGWYGGYSQGSGFTFSYTGPNQILVGPACEAPLQWGHPNTPTVSSNIPGGMIVSFTIYSISGGYQIGDLIPGGTTVTVFYQALDNFGNTALFGFTIAFIDVLPPIFDPLSLPHNITVSCTSNVPPPAAVEATDNCDNDNANLTITLTQTNNAQPCTGGSIIRTWVADDDLGNTSSFVQTITVSPDNTPPVIANNLQNGMAPCSTAMAQYTIWLNTQRANFSATDNGCGVMSLTDNAPSPAIITSFCGAIDVTFTAKDNCNNISTVVKTFSIFNSVAPVITTPATGASGNCSQSNINQIFNNWIANHGGATATDDCSSIFWTTYPPSPSIHDTCDAEIPVLFIAGDGCGNYDTTAASFILTDDTPPVITMDPGTIVLSCSAAGIDSTLMDWLITGGNSAAHDLCTSDDDLTLGYKIGGNALTLEEVLDAWQDSLASGCKDNVLIGGLGINNVKGYLALQFTYTDKCDNEVGKTGYFGITDNGRPTYVTMPMDTALACAQNGNWESDFQAWYDSAGYADYTDLCSAVTVSANITADSAIHYLSAALDTACNQGVEVTIQFTLTDECGNRSQTSPSATFSLQDTLAPTLVTPAMDVNAMCSSNAQMQLEAWIDTLGGAKATDGCSALLWTFSWIDTSGMQIMGVPGEGPYPDFSGMDCMSGIQVIFTVSDICQNSTSDTAGFSLIDTIPPAILLQEDTIHLVCHDTVPLIIPGVSDGCDTAPLLTYADSVSADSCLGLPIEIIRTWTAMDACGNVATAQQWFFRVDTIPPTFELPAGTISFCSLDSLALINVQDNCDPAPVTTWADEISGDLCSRMLTRTWSVSDACGNVATAIQQFDLSDTVPPAIVVSPGHFIYTCSDTSGDLQEAYEQWQSSVEIQDGCSEAGYFIALPGSYQLEDTLTWPGTAVPDSVFLTCQTDVFVEADLVVYDACGNASYEAISFAVKDTIPPSFVECVAVISVLPDTLTCTGLVTMNTPEVEEVCFPDSVHLYLSIDGGASLLMDTLASIDTILAVGIHQALWTATDCKGNAATCQTQIELIDENAIALTCPPDTLMYTTATRCDTNVWIYPPLTNFGKCSGGLYSLRYVIEEGAVPDSAFFESANDSILVNLIAGVHPVYLIARDSTGDIDTCIYTIDLRDTFPPEITCQNDTLWLHSSGTEDIDLGTTHLLVSSSDACGIDTVVYFPPSVNCASNGLDLDIMLVAIDPSGNTTTCQSLLHVETLPLKPLWERQLCDDTLRLFANIPPGPPANYTFMWTGPDGFVSGEENPYIPDSDTTQSGTYQLTILSESGCVSTGEVDVLVEILASPEITITDDTICMGEAITLQSQAYAGDVTYTWYQVDAAMDTLSLDTTIEPILSFVPGLTGSFSYYAVVTQDTCTSVPGNAVGLFVAPVPVTSILDPAGFLCVTDTLYLSPETIIDSLQYHWTGPEGYVSDTATPPGIPADSLLTGDLFVLTAATAYCVSVPDSLLVPLQLPPATPVIEGDSLACEEGSFFLSTTTSYGTYTWIDPSGQTFDTASDSLLVSPATMSQTGNWFVIAFDNGCPSDTSAAFEVRVDTAIQIDIIAPTVACENDTITLSVNPSLDGIYAWSGPGGFTSFESSPKTNALAGTYSVFVTTPNGCEAEDETEIEVDLRPDITALQTDADTCVNGLDPVRIWAETTPGYANQYVYSWDGPAGFTAQDSSIVITQASSQSNGVYSVVITNGTCISDTAFITLSLKDSPSPPVIPGDHVYCFGDSIILAIDAPIAGAQYAWTSQDSNVVIESPGTLIIPNATPDWTGVYRVQVTVDGCTSALTQVAVQVKGPLFAPSVITAPLVCEGDSLILMSNAPPGAILHWISSNGFDSNEEQPVIYPAGPEDAGTYQVAYIFNGCPSPPSNPYDIEVQSAVPPPVITTDINSVCIDNPVPVTLCIDPSTLTPGATYAWWLNGTTPIGVPGTDSCLTILGDPLTEGVNAISVTASIRGCPSPQSNAVDITGDAYPATAADAGLDITVCPGDQVQLTGSDPSPGTGLWSSQDDIVIFSDPTDPNADIVGLPSGMYSMAWTLSYASCLDYSQDSVNVTVLFAPETVPDTFDVPFGQTLEFNVIMNDQVSMDPFTVSIVAQPQKGNVLHVGNGIFRYSPNIGFVGTDMMIYRICSTECPDVCSESLVILKVGNEDDCFVPTLFTPNQDGVNDILIVPCLETDKYPDNKIIIFNEWGGAVFTASPYHNDWDGTAGGQALPVGTYFYIMDFGDGSTPKHSFLVLER